MHASNRGMVCIDPLAPQDAGLAPALTQALAHLGIPHIDMLPQFMHAQTLPPTHPHPPTHQHVYTTHLGSHCTEGQGHGGTRGTACVGPQAPQGALNACGQLGPPCECPQEQWHRHWPAQHVHPLTPVHTCVCVCVSVCVCVCVCHQMRRL